MSIVKIYSAKRLKEIDRKLIKDINGIEFGETYPKLNIEGEHVIYQEPSNNCPIYIQPPFVVTL